MKSRVYASSVIWSPMADTRRCLPNQHLGLSQILQESKNRWLRPAEICEILRNYQNFELTTDPPVRPPDGSEVMFILPGGSLYLFDRKALRYFRKDGHRWRKKKDGKTVKEAHEKLKHIVLVHYRNVEEANSAARMYQTSFASSPAQTSFASSPIQTSFASSPVQTSFASSPNRVDMSGQTLSTEFEDVDSRRDAGISSIEQPMLGSIFHNASLRPQKIGGFPESFRDPSSTWYGGPKFDHGAGLSVWHGMDSSTRNEHSMHAQNLFVEEPNRVDLITNKLTDSRVDVRSGVNDVTCEDRLTTNIDVQIVSAPSQREDQVPKEHVFDVLHPQVQDYTDPQIVVTPSDQVGENYRDGGVHNVELKKLDSFGRWMDKEIGVDCDDSLMASDSGNYWSTFDAKSGDKEVSSLSHHMQLDIDSLGPFLSQEQLFSISDFSPDWAYSGTETKVLIVGSFLGSKKDSADTNWGCMFGEIEVSAKILSNNAIRCQTPLHAPGRVPFYVTGRIRLACSEIREFEYREKPIGIAINNLQDDELHFQIQLAKLLSLGSKRKWLICTVPDCDECKLKSSIFSMRGNSESDWVTIDGASVSCKSDHLSRRDVLIQNLLKDRLCEWLVCKIHGGGKGPHVLDNEGQGVLHLTAALGYKWAVGPVIAAGISPNFRDARGRTGLHWASYFGREETVIALLRLGATPGAVEDPTSIFHGGQTAADLASSRGHKGIAGYLAEADLTNHLELLTMNENTMSNVTATIAAENANQTAEVAASAPVDEQHSLKNPIAAVRK